MIGMRHVLTYAYLGLDGGASAPFGGYIPYLNWTMTGISTADAISALGIKTMVYTNPKRETTNSNLYTDDDSTFAHSCSGSRIQDSEGMYLMNPASRDLWSLWADELTRYKSRGHVDAFESDDADDVYGADATPCAYNTMDWLSATISEDTAAGGPIVYNNLGLFGWDRVSPGIALNASAIGGIMEKCYAERGNTPHIYGGYWRAIENTELQMAAAKKYLFCFALSRTVGASAIASRNFVYASFLLTYDPSTSILLEDYPTRPSNFWVYPESGLVALNPLVPAPATISSLEVSSDVYAREYAACYVRGSYIGPCAAVVNPDSSSPHPLPLTGYHRAMTLNGGGVFDGGTMALNGPVPSSLSSLTGLVVFR